MGELMVTGEPYSSNLLQLELNKQIYKTNNDDSDKNGNNIDILDNLHCVKSVQIRSYFWSEYRKTRTRNNSVVTRFFTFYK